MCPFRHNDLPSGLGISKSISEIKGDSGSRTASAGVAQNLPVDPTSSSYFEVECEICESESLSYSISSKTGDK